MGMTLKARNDIHLARRLWHFVGVMFIYFLYWKIPPAQSKIAVVVLGAPLLLLDILRLYFPALNKIILFLFKPFMREQEKRRLAAISFMLVGVTFNILFLPRTVVPLTLLFLAVADPLASFVGINWGKDKLVGNKSLQGSFAAFVACFLLSLGYFRYMEMMHERMFIVCLLAGLIGAASELMPVGKLDDNLVFPVMSGILLTGLFAIFGGLT